MRVLELNQIALSLQENKKLEITADGKIHVTKIQGEGIDVKARDYEQNTSALSSKDINISANSN